MDLSAWQPESIGTVLAAIPEEEPAKYDHGFSEEEVADIKNKRLELEKRRKEGGEITLDEFKTVIIPFCRISRTEDFNIVEKVQREKKVRKPRAEKPAKAPRVPKPKKLTKAQTNALLQTISIKKMGNIPLNESELKFLEDI